MGSDATVLVIGATGMLGRPVVRRLVQDGVVVRAMVRDVKRARAVLPARVELVPGDLRDRDSVVSAMHGARACHLNLAAPMARRPPKWDPERDGTAVVADLARRVGLERITRTSALGVEEAAGQWWAARHKLEADRAVIACGVPHTIFRPTWFMESIPLFKMGPLLMCFRLPGSRLRWLAGDDFAKQVAAALNQPETAAKIHVVQGPEPLTMTEALRRFARAWAKPLMVVPAMRLAPRVSSPLSGKAHYFDRLLQMTERHFARLDRHRFENDLPPATMTIEDYVRYVEVTGDLPQK